MTSRRRELIVREQVADPDEHQLPVVHADEVHAAKPDPCPIAGIVGEHDLVRWQRYPEAGREVHERARRTVADDWQHRFPVALPQDGRWPGEVDE